MATELGKRLGEARAALGWSLREVERRTGINNAHLVQIEKGGIERPDPNILWTLATVYDVDFEELMRLAGHVEERGTSRPVFSAALRALGELTPDQQRQALEFMAQLRRSKQR